MRYQYYVYIATNVNNTVSYTGVTNNVPGRMYQHRNKLLPGFTAKYNVNKCIYYEVFSTPREAIEAEKRIEGWTRRKKIILIQGTNPRFEDLIQPLDSSPAGSE